MKVSVRRVRTETDAASTTPETAGCDEAPASEEPLAPAGSGDLELQLGPAGTLLVQITNSTTDELVRVGESLRGALAGYVLWETLHPEEPIPDDARLSQLQATLSLHFLDRGQEISTADLPVTRWSSTLYGLHGYTDSTVVPPETDTIQLTLTLTDAASPGVSAHLDATRVSEVPVFGGDLPDKTLFFDQNQGVLRHRIVEGGSLVAGSRITLGYSDWRADQMVDRSNLNTQIGVATGFGRFGQYQQPIHGKLVYEVTCGAHFDDDAGWRPEAPLAATTSSRLLGAGRTDYEAELLAPAGAHELQMYAHVKAYLVADYAPFSDVTQKWYQDGERVLLKDVYDNPGGAFTNYAFHLR